MNPIEEIQNQIIDDFSLFEDWMSKYEYIIDLGKKLEPLDSQYKTQENMVLGCQSPAWIIGELRDGKMYYKADGDAVITKGMLYLLLQIVNGQKPEDIVNADFFFVKEIGLDKNLSPSRANGLASMIDRIKQIASKYVNK